MFAWLDEWATQTSIDCWTICNRVRQVTPGSKHRTSWYNTIHHCKRVSLITCAYPFNLNRLMWTWSTVLVFCHSKEGRTGKNFKSPAWRSLPVNWTTKIRAGGHTYLLSRSYSTIFHIWILNLYFYSGPTWLCQKVQFVIISYLIHAYSTLVLFTWLHLSSAGLHSANTFLMIEHVELIIEVLDIENSLVRGLKWKKKTRYTDRYNRAPKPG